MSTIKITSAFQRDFYEYAAWKEGKLILGIDEVGRGCLAGPVVAAAAVLKPHTKHPLIRDSKTLTQEQLAEAYNWLCSHAIFSIGIVSSWYIDQYNIYQATQIAMKQACAALLVQVSDIQHIVIDAMPLILPIPFPDVLSFTKGESKSRSIAAASIAAKVTRDALMRSADQFFSPYQFATHKGYATEVHRKAIKAHGRCLIHRTSFSLEDDCHDTQNTLFS